MSVNIAEILVANCSGMAIVTLMLLVRRSINEARRASERIYIYLLAATLAGLFMETVSFIIDGKQFFGCVALQYLSNTVSTGATVLVGLFWCLFANYRIFRNEKQLKSALFHLSMPFLIVSLILFINLFGTEIIFGVSENNTYFRGPLNIIVYIALFYYYTESIIMILRSKKRGISVKFFPVHLFVAPCVIGTVIQGIFYGIAVGWFSVAIALIFVTLLLETFNSFVDDMSGLFSRKYLNQYLNKIQNSHRSDVYGIMLDANNFKCINDQHGHDVGDRAIRNIGQILSDVTYKRNATALRMAGDEFLVLLPDGSPEAINNLKKYIDEDLVKFNSTTSEPYRLSLSMGIAKCNNGNVEEFLSDMDRKMYSAKREYHLYHDESNNNAIKYR